MKNFFVLITFLFVSWSVIGQNWAEITTVLPDALPKAETDQLYGNTYTSNNNTATFTYLGAARNEWDSTVTLDLSIHENGWTGLVTACASSLWIDGIQNLAGYDSLMVINLIVNTSSTVSFTGLVASYMVTDSDVTLTGTPVGGAFSGNGIVGDSFS